MQKKKILVIDDDQGILEALRAILEMADYFVDTTDDISYLDKIEEKGLPNIILVDLLLSGTDGTKVIKKLKCSKSTSEIPVIMLSAHPLAGDSARQSGADDFLAKPFDMDELLDKIQKNLKG